MENRRIRRKTGVATPRKVAVLWNAIVTGQGIGEKDIFFLRA